MRAPYGNRFLKWDLVWNDSAMLWVAKYNFRLVNFQISDAYKFMKCLTMDIKKMSSCYTFYLYM